MSSAIMSSSSRGRSRSRSGKRSRSMVSLSRSRSRTSNPGATRNWPYQGVGWSQYYDPFPAKAKALLRYSQNVTLNASAGIPAHHLFRATSIFDPDFSGLGHQPYGHDSYQAIYNHYVVDKAVCTVTLASQAANQVIGVSLTDDSAVNADPETIRETKGTRFLCCPNLQDERVLQMTFMRNQVYAASQSTQQGTFGSNPVDNAFFDVWQTGNTAVGDPAAVNLVVSITYFVTMWELKDLGQS